MLVYNTDNLKQYNLKTLITADRLFVLEMLSKQCSSFNIGSIIECGVYKGGSLKLLAETNPNTVVYGLDTFEGMPDVNKKFDLHNKGDFRETSEEEVLKYVNSSNLILIKGFIPDTFKSLENEKFCFVHIDVDIYQSVVDCVDFLLPRLSVGGVMIFDDYGFPSCPGAKKAVDEKFKNSKLIPLPLQNGQCVVFKTGV